MKNILELDLNLFLVGRGPQPPPIHGDRVGALDPDQDVTEHQYLDFGGENRSGVAKMFYHHDLNPAGPARTYKSSSCLSTIFSIYILEIVLIDSCLILFFIFQSLKTIYVGLRS